MIPTNHEIADNLFRALFPLPKYQETPKTFNEYFDLRPGDKIITREGEYRVLKGKKVTCKEYPLQTIFRPTLFPLAFIPYTATKTATLRNGVNPHNLVIDLATIIRQHLILEQMAEDAEDSIKARELIGIGRRVTKNVVAKARKRLEILKPSQSNEKLLRSLWAVLESHTEGINGNAMAFYYLSAIFLASGLETGTGEKVADRLRHRHKTLSFGK